MLEKQEVEKQNFRQSNLEINKYFTKNSKFFQFIKNLLKKEIDFLVLFIILQKI